MINRQIGSIDDYLTPDDISERGMVVDEYGAVYEFQNEENDDFENPFCNEDGQHYHELKQSKVAYVNTNVTYDWPDNWHLDELLSRSLPHEAIYNKKNLEHNSEISTNEQGQRTISINMVLEYAFPTSFTPRKIAAKINEIVPGHPFEITHIVTTDMAKNGYEANYANQYTFTQVTDIADEPSLTDIHCTAFSYKDACKQVLDGIESQDESLSSTTFATTPSQNEIDKYKNLTLTKYDSATHQPEIVILPDSGKIIDEMGFILEPDDLNYKNFRSINDLTMGFENSLSEKDLSILRHRKNQIITGITNIYLRNNPEEYAQAKIDFEEILKLPEDKRGYTKDTFGLWVYNNVIPDTDKLTSYLVWSEVSHNEKTDFSKHKNLSKIRTL